MFACRRVDAFFAQQQPCDRPVIDDVRFDDLGDVFIIDTTVPDCVWVNHYSWAMFALIQTASPIGSHPILQAACRQFFFEG